MKSLLSFLAGKKTYLVSIGAIIYAIGIYKQWWPSSAEIWGLFGAGGAMTIRAAIKRLCQQIAADPALEDRAPQPEVRRATLPLVIVFLVPAFMLSGCASWYKPAQTEAGAAIVAQVSDKVIKNGIEAAAAKIDETGNPFLHSVADALRANSGSIVNPADVQRIAVNYGDPNNKTKFQQLGADLWVLLKNAASQFGKVAGTELVAQGLNGVPPEKAAATALAVQSP